ncbi:MAG: hypothetical protein AB7P67_01870 [Vicinamibacterales bacterium]
MFVCVPALAARCAAGAVCLSGLLAGPVFAQATTAQPDAATVQAPGGLPPAPGVTPAAGAPAPDRIFATEAGMLISPIKADRVKDFEAVMARLHQALATSTDETRRRQAAGWRLYRATEAGPSSSVIYVSVLSPAVPKADYTVGKILLEAFPLDEVQDLHERYTAAFAGAQTILSLRPLADFGEPWQPPPPAPR